MLEPCLFCGTTERIIYIADDEPVYLDVHERGNGEMYYVHCGRCMANGPEAMSRRLAIVKWNRGIKNLKKLSRRKKS